MALSKPSDDKKATFCDVTGPHKAEATITWELTDFAEKLRMVNEGEFDIYFSPHVLFRGIKFRIEVQIINYGIVGRFLGLFLEARCDKPEWTISIGYKLILHRGSQQEVHTDSREFNAIINGSGYGWSHLEDVSTLLDPSKGYIKNDTITFSTEIWSEKPTLPKMEYSRDFTAPDILSDVILLVDDQKLHVNKAFLSTLSPFFSNMFMKNFTESHQTEVQLMGPPGMEYEEFLGLLKVIHPPHQEINASSYERLLNLACYFDIDRVFRDVDKFLLLDKEHDQVSFIEKVMTVDKYCNLNAAEDSQYERLSGTKKMVMGELKNVDVATEVKESSEYATLSAEMKVKLLQNLVDASKV